MALHGIILDTKDSARSRHTNETFQEWVARVGSPAGFLEGTGAQGPGGAFDPSTPMPLPVQVSGFEKSAAVLQQEQDQRNLDRSEAGDAAAIATLRGTSTDILARQASNDPDRDFITDLLERRINEPLFTDQQRSAADLQIAQSVARAQAGLAANAAGRGVAGSGLALGREAGLNIQGDALGLQLSAGFDQADREAQDRALGAFASFQTQMERTDLAVDSIIAGIDSQIASIQNDVPIESTDFIAFRSLELAEQMFEDERVFRNDMLDAFEESQETDIFDYITLTFEAFAAGGPATNLLAGILG